jgi:cob(I)alamin adenosyltransferase
MNIQLIQGQFSTQDAIEIITRLINVKIKFHENKINNAFAEEDIKMREKRIKQLQQQLHESRNYIQKQGENISIESELLFK